MLSLFQLIPQNWEEFKGQFNKQYASEEEELRRQAIFLENLQFIDGHNAATSSYMVAMNKYGDLTAKEFALQV